MHQLSAFFFYLLGSSFFVAYVMFRQSFGWQWPVWWMQVADLPLAASAILYGGLSVYLSMSGKKGSSKTIAWLIGVPLGGFFIFLVVLNFWNVL